MAFKTYESQPSSIDWLGDAEEYFAPKLRGVSLVAETNFDQSDVTNALSALGQQHRRSEARGTTPSWLLRRYPATCLVALAGAGAVLSHRGEYWPPVLDKMRLPNQQRHQQFWGQGFRDALGKFRLPSFGHLPLRNLGPIMMHGGIPNASLGDLVDLLSTRRTHEPGMTAESFLAWAFAPGLASRLQSLSKPVQYFLENGSEFALDLLERILEVVDYLAANPADAQDGVLTSETTGLPAVTLAKLCQLIRDGDVDLQPARRPASRHNDRANVPRIELDTGSQTVQIALPEVSDCGGRVTWTIFADGHRRSVESIAGWVGADQPAPATSFTLDHPVRAVQVSRTPNDANAVLDLVDPADPLLLFDSAGSLIRPRTPIPRGTVWAVFPADRQLVDEAQREIPLVIDGLEPVGWTRWRLSLADTTKAEAIGLASTDQSGPGRQRQVRHDALPEINIGNPIRGLYTPGGLPVYSDHPHIVLPDDTSGNIVWTIEVRRDGAPTPVESPRQVVTRDTRECPALSAIRDPMLGSYVISVRGPLGRRVTSRVSIAEGISTICEPQLRHIIGPSVEPAAVEITSAAGLIINRQHIDFPHDQIEQIVQVSSPSGRTATFTMRPPHMATLLETSETRGQWTPSRARITTDQMTTGSNLHVRMPGFAAGAALTFKHDGELRQKQPAARGQGSDIVRFDLSKFADTAADCGRGELSVEIAGRIVEVAAVRPPVYATGAEHSNGAIQLVDFNATPDLKAALYACTAPWLGARVRDISDDGVVEVPDDFQGAGRLLIFLAEEDPWGGFDWPAWPTTGALVLEQLGQYQPASHAEQALSHLLDESSTGLPDETVAPVTTSMWQTLSVIDHLGLASQRRKYVAETFVKAISASPDRAWESLIDATFTEHATCELAIGSGLIEYATDPHSSPGAIRGLWTRSPMAAALLAMTNLINPSDDELADIAELEYAIESNLGTTAQTIAEELHDANREVGTFGPTALAMSKKHKADVEAIWQAAQVVPSGLLEADSRAAAARGLFDQRDAKVLKPVLEGVPSELQWMRREVRDYGNKAARAQLEARFETGRNPERWQFLPALSFAYAACARFRAWFPGKLPPFRSSSRRLWRMLASAAPAMVETDIVLADLLISAPMRRLPTYSAVRNAQFEEDNETEA